MLINSRLKVTQIIGQKKAFYRQRIPESRFARKKVCIHPYNIEDQLQKNQAIYQNNEQIPLEKKEVEPLEPVQLNIDQSSTYQEMLAGYISTMWPRLHEKQEVKDQQSYISVLVAFLTFPSSSTLHCTLCCHRPDV